MADLTLERIAELRADMELLDQDVFECGGEFAMVTLDSRKLKALLDAAERGLTAMAWTVNGPDVEKPVGSMLLFRALPGYAVMGEWNAVNDRWDTDDKDPSGRMRSYRDNEISHFMAIKEPTNA